MGTGLEDSDWKILIQRIGNGECTPFLGAGACFGLLPLGADIAKEWAERYGYPFEDSYDLIKVAQYVAVKSDAMTPKEEIAATLARVVDPDPTDTGEPHRVLSRLPLPVYVTTNYDDLMARALKARKKDACQELCRWNRAVADHPSRFDGGYEPTVANPVVFHIHGHVPVKESLVLTEDDYLAFLTNMVAEDIVPAPIRKALTGTSLLFVGYRLADWNFRVLLRSLTRYLDPSLKRLNVAVMPPPAESDVTQKKIQDYLTQYYSRIDVKVYWGTAREFVAELADRSRASGADFI